MMPFSNMNMAMDPQAIIQQALQQNPNLAKNPQAQQYIQILMSGDAQKGQEVAKNICQTYGLSPEQGVQQAQDFFQKQFGGRR